MRLRDNAKLVDELCGIGLHPDDIINASSVLMRGRRLTVLAMLDVVDAHLASRPATGAEFVAAALAAIDPRSDEEIREIIEDIERR